MTKKELAILHLAEEAAEVICAASKVLRFGSANFPHKGKVRNPKVDLEQEISNLEDQISYLRMLRMVGKDRSKDRYLKRVRRMREYRELSRKLGCMV